MPPKPLRKAYMHAEWEGWDILHRENAVDPGTGGTTKGAAVTGTEDWKKKK